MDRVPGPHRLDVRTPRLRIRQRARDSFIERIQSSPEIGSDDDGGHSKARKPVQDAVGLLVLR